MQVLFALNERYLVNEKGSVKTVDSFSLRPEAFGDTVSAVLARPGEHPAQRTASIERFEELVRAVRTISDEGPRQNP